MKKFTVLATAVASLFALTACDPEEIIDDIIDSADGDMTLTVTSATEGNHPLHQGDTIHMSTMLCGVDNENPQSRFVGIKDRLHSDLLDDDNFPVFAMTLIDSVAGEYAIDLPLNDPAFIATLDWKNLATSVNEQNIFLIAIDKDNYYLAQRGTIVIDTFGTDGEQATGTVASLMCKYLTSDMVDHIATLWEASRNTDDPEAQARARAELNAIDWDTQFENIVLNGSFACLRQNISKYVRAIEALVEE